MNAEEDAAVLESVEGVEDRSEGGPTTLLAVVGSNAGWVDDNARASGA